MAITTQISSSEVGKSDLKKLTDTLRINELCHDDIELSTDHYYKVEAGGEIVGYFGIEKYESYGLLRSVVILEKFRGNGLGEELMIIVKQKANGLRLQSLFLLTTAASGFFSRFGFQIMAREKAPISILESHEFQNFCPSTAICMVKHFNQDE